MGSNISKEILENDESKLIRQLAETSGSGAVKKYISENRNKWQTVQVKFAITGRSATGKSTFINAIRNVRPGDPMFAKPGSGNTTKQPEPYEDPKNSKIVIGEDDSWMIKALKELRKPFCLIRSKIDDDVNSAKYDGRDEKLVIPEILEKIETDRRKHNAEHPDNIIDKDNIFLISSRDKRIGDLDRLINHIEVNLPTIKCEAMMYSISLMSKEVIDKKYAMLKKRIFVVTAAATAIAVIPVPGLDAAINTGIIVEEVIHYMNVFGLREKDLQEVPEHIKTSLKCRNIFKPGAELAKFIVFQVGKLMAGFTVATVADFILPIIGSVIAASATAPAVYSFLSSYLDEIRNDATILFEYNLD